MRQVCENCGWRALWPQAANGENKRCIFLDPGKKRAWNQAEYNQPCGHYVMDIVLEEHLRKLLGLQEPEPDKEVAMTNAEALSHDLQRIDDDEVALHVVQYIACPDRNGVHDCSFNGSDETVCVECKIKWLRSKQEVFRRCDGKSNQGL